jgi:hypothetical protein
LVAGLFVGTGGQAFGTSADRKSLSMVVNLTIYNGTISKSREVAEVEPPGHYLVTAHIGQSAPAQFEFDVIAPR